MAAAPVRDRRRARVPAHRRLGIGPRQRAPRRASRSGPSTSDRATQPSLTTPGGATILVDGGPERDQVATELAALGIKRLDMVVATHPHADHIAGLPSVLARIPVGVLLHRAARRSSPAAGRLDRAIADEGVPEVQNPRAGDVFRLGDPPLGRVVARPVLDGYGVRREQRLIVILLSSTGHVS